MSLKLIHGPLNSGRRGLILRSFAASLERDPLLVVPNLDDVFDFEREICEGGATLGGAVTTFGGLFREVLAAGGSPPGPELTKAQRLRAVSVGIAEHRGELGPLRRASLRPGFAAAFERLLDEMQAAGLDPERTGAGADTLEGSAYLGDLTTAAAGYAAVRDRLGLADAHQIAHEAIALLRDSPKLWGGRPVLLYGFDDLTRNQLELLEALTPVAEVTIALPYEEGRTALEARGELLAKLRARVDGADEIAIEPDRANTESAMLFHLEREFGRVVPERRRPDGSLTLLRSAGARGECEAIGIEIAKLLSSGVEPAEIAIVLRDPVRHGPRLAEILESYGIATALEAELPVSATATGGALLALLEAEFGSRRADDLLRYLRGPSGASPASVDWLERALRRGRVRSADRALEEWTRDGREPFHDVIRIREAAQRSPAELAEAVGRLAETMAARPLRDEGEGAIPAAEGEGLELRAAAEIARALAELGEMSGLCPAPDQLAATIGSLFFQAWSGPVAERVRIADPYRLRAGRFDHVFVASLQDGEFPRRDRAGDPFVSERQRASLGLDPRRDDEAEERYLFYTCISLPRKRLYLSYRDSDENGAAETRSPLLDDVRRLLDPPATQDGPDLVEESISRVRDLAAVAQPVDEAPSEDELARAIAARGAQADVVEVSAAAVADAEIGTRIAARIDAARRAERASRGPGPLSSPAVLESLASAEAYGGTTLEEFDVCSYRWFAGHELDPQLLDPAPDPLVQGGLMHEALEHLYRERPEGDPLPRPASLAAWIERARRLVGELCAERGLGAHPAERAMARRVERLLARFLAEESRRDTGGFEPWLLEAAFGEQEGSDRPVLEIDGWGLHGAIDRVDRAADGRALVLDYKLSGQVTPREKLEERAKLQLQLYLLAVAEHWDGVPVGGLYHPLRGTSARRPRGAVLESAAGELAGYRLYDGDLVDDAGLDELLTEARKRAARIVARIRSGDIRRDPGPRPGLRDHDVCPAYCQFAPICRRDRAPVSDDEFEVEER